MDQSVFLHVDVDCFMACFRVDYSSIVVNSQPARNGGLPIQVADGLRPTRAYCHARSCSSRLPVNHFLVNRPLSHHIPGIP